MSHSQGLQQLINVLKYKIKNNTTFYVTKQDFKNHVLNVFTDAVLIPTKLPTGNNEIFFSVMYKVEPTDKNIKDIDEVGEGIIKMTYEELSSLLICGRLVAYYTDKNGEDREIKKLIKEIGLI